MKRECGECNLCCKLLPVHDNEPWRKGPAINKPAGVRCPHQRHAKGCAIYETAMPFCCKAWNCRWLVNDDMADQSRPDRSHLVVDVMPDYITLQDNETGQETKIQVVQVWCDPKHRDAHRDPTFRRYLERLGDDGIAAIIRYNSRDAVTIFPPQIASDHQWHEITGGTVVNRTEAEISEFLTGAKFVAGDADGDNIHHVETAEQAFDLLRSIETKGR